MTSHKSSTSAAEEDKGLHQGNGKRSLSPSLPESPSRTKRPRLPPPPYEKYLNEINRSALDFDLPPICSVSLVSHSVYACLTCGRYFHGRKPSTPAHTHSLQESHHLFINLTTSRVYCLPDDYEIIDSSLDDIISALHPKFQPRCLPELDTHFFQLQLAGGHLRIRGAVGLDSMHGSNAANVILQLILRPRVIRNVLLLQNTLNCNPSNPLTHSHLSDALAIVCRKMWASHAFRPHVAPHAFMQFLSAAAGKQPSLISKSDPLNILSWILNSLSSRSYPHSTSSSDSSSARKFSKLIKKSFQGVMCISSTPDSSTTTDQTAQKRNSKFWLLSLDLPPKPLFKHQSERDIVPQISLEQLLEKYNGHSKVHVVETGGFKTHEVVRLPSLLFLVVKRFTTSKFGVEKNPCLVHLPTGYLDVGKIWNSVGGQYRLIGAISHEGSLEKGQFQVSIFHEAAKTWYDVTNVAVKSTVLQLISLKDSYILLYERIDDDESIAES